jgi:hypothetical protein
MVFEMYMHIYTAHIIITVYFGGLAVSLNTHIEHKGIIQPIQHTDCTTGQASLHVGGDGTYGLPPTIYTFR